MNQIIIYLAVGAVQGAISTVFGLRSGANFKKANNGITAALKDANWVK